MAGVRRLPLPQPYDVAWTSWYLRMHAVPGVESWQDGRYASAYRSAAGPDVLSVRFDGGAVEVGRARGPVDDEVTALVDQLLDLTTDGNAVDAHLAADPAFAPSVAAAPGMRLAGALDGWELLLRTMVGQQISLAAARTHLARLARALGEPVAAQRFPEITRLLPTAEAVATEGHRILTGPGRRVAAVVGAARAVAAGDIDLRAGTDGVRLRRDLLLLKGVGPWTADYVAMRLVPDPDVLLGSDLVVKQGADVLGVDLAGQGAAWSPYRSYATICLWRAALEARGVAVE